MSDTKDIHDYPGEKVDVHWDRRLCIHVGECGRAANELFVGGRDPWCLPDTVDLASAVEVVERCPTGALTYTRKDGAREAKRVENTVWVANNGPLYLSGELAIDGAADDMAGVAHRARRQRTCEPTAPWRPTPMSPPVDVSG